MSLPVSGFLSVQREKEKFALEKEKFAPPTSGTKMNSPLSVPYCHIVLLDVHMKGQDVTVCLCLY